LLLQMARITCKNCNSNGNGNCNNRATATSTAIHGNGSKENYACNNIYIHVCASVGVWCVPNLFANRRLRWPTSQQANKATQQQTNRPEVTFSFQTFSQLNIKGAEWKAQYGLENKQRVQQNVGQGNQIKCSSNDGYAYEKHGKAILKSINVDHEELKNMVFIRKIKKLHHYFFLKIIFKIMTFSYIYTYCRYKTWIFS